MIHTNDNNAPVSENRDKLYKTVVGYMSRNGGQSPTLAYLCNELGVTKPTVVHHRRKLVEDGFLELVDGKMRIPGAVSNSQYLIPPNVINCSQIGEHDVVVSDNPYLNVQVASVEGLNEFVGRKTAVITDSEQMKAKAIELGFSVYTIKQVYIQEKRKEIE